MRFYIHKPLPCTPLPVSKRHGQTADKGRTAADDLNGQGRGCAPRSAGHTVPMNDPEAESKNAPQEEKIPAWLKWFRILVITSFLFVVGVVLWVFWIIKVNLDKWPTVQ